jgi:murein DD-endopeptidase MepM/ murein hydrolase activator NlpD
MRWQYNPAGSARPALRRIVLITALCAAGFAAAAYYDPNSQPPASVVQPVRAVAAVGIPLRDPQPGEFDRMIQAAVGDALQAPAARVPEASDWKTVRVASGQSLSNIFDDLGVSPDNWMAMVKLGGEAAQLKHLRTGDVLNLRIEGDRVNELTYALDETRTLDVRRGAAGYDAAILTSAIERRNVQTAGVIEDSLFNDGRRARISDRLILQFADIFNYDIDFAQDLQPGDRFAVVYDVLYKNGKKLRDGDIVAAEFINQGHVYRAVRYIDTDGHSAYYTPDGQSLKKAFIRTPVDFARISSGFNLHRRHPGLNTIRAHKGVDYAAPMGTPVKATGDGRIEFEGRKGGYGNLIVIKHWGPYETAYGHMMRFKPGIGIGSKVRMGQVIGYVGMTGLATGPHLHYEFRVNGIHQNPVTVPLPRANPILGRQAVAQFHTQTAPLVAQLDAAKTAQLASAASPGQAR